MFPTKCATLRGCIRSTGNVQGCLWPGSHSTQPSFCYILSLRQRNELSQSTQKGREERSGSDTGWGARGRIGSFFCSCTCARPPTQLPSVPATAQRPTDVSCTRPHRNTRRGKTPLRHRTQKQRWKPCPLAESRQGFPRSLHSTPCSRITSACASCAVISISIYQPALAAS